MRKLRRKQAAEKQPIARRKAKRYERGRSFFVLVCLGSAKCFYVLVLEVRFLDKVRLMVEESITKCLIMFLLFI